MRYTFLLYSDPAMAANMTEEDWAKSKEIYGPAPRRYGHNDYTGRWREAGSGWPVRRNQGNAGWLLCH